MPRFDPKPLNKPRFGFWWRAYFVFFGVFFFCTLGATIWMLVRYGPVLDRLIMGLS